MLHQVIGNAKQLTPVQSASLSDVMLTLGVLTACHHSNNHVPPHWLLQIGLGEALVLCSLLLGASTIDALIAYAMLVFVRVRVLALHIADLRRTMVNLRVT